MFEIGRELKRWFSASALKDGVRDGFCVGDESLLELLDLNLLQPGLEESGLPKPS